MHNDFLAEFKSSYYCKYGDFFVDSKIPVKKVVVSHAHADHAIPGCEVVYCTEATRRMMLHRYGDAAAKEFKVYDYFQPFKISEVEIMFIPAGHILGSAQVLMEFDGVKYLYTGDYKLQNDTTCEELQFVKADVLITETTFANPDYSHPNAIVEVEKLNLVSKQPILIGAYALGKAQRITKLISDCCPSKRILIHSDIYPFHKIYENLGVNLGNWQVYTRNIAKNSADNVYIVPPSVFRRYSKNSGYLMAFTSGWNKHHVGRDIELKISDHGDWNDLLRLIKMVEPKKIITVHGDGTVLKQFLNGGSIEVFEIYPHI